MPEQLETIAEAIRAQLLALAPDGVAGPLQSLPSVALLAVVAGVALLLLWIVLAALGAVFGGGRRKREREVEAELEARRHQHERGDDRRSAASDRRGDPAPPLRTTPKPGPGLAPGPAAAPSADLGARHDELMIRGDRQAQGNDFNGALATFKDALDVARQLAFQRPDAPEPQRLVAKALHKVGDASGRLGDGHAARQYHEQALVLLRRVHSVNPRDAGIARELAVTLERLGTAAAQGGDRNGARAVFEEELRIAGQMANQEQNDLSWVRFKAVVHIMLGNLNDHDSRAHYEQARQLFETLERANVIQELDAQTLQQLRGVLQA